MYGGLRYNMLIPKDDPRKVSDALGERREKEKVFTEWPKVGWIAGKWTS